MARAYRDELLQGRQAIAHLIHVWHEMNGWSHKVLPALSECLDLPRLHNSQISNLRNGKLVSPGPEVFLALAKLNGVLAKGLEPIREHLADVHPELLKVLLESAIPLAGDDGEPIGAGNFFEIFVGITSLPASLDWFIEEHEASCLSAALAENFCDGKPWRNCCQQVMEAYTVKKPYRRERFASVMAGLTDYSAIELDRELFDLFAAYRVLGGSASLGCNDFLEELRSSAVKNEC